MKLGQTRLQLLLVFGIQDRKQGVFVAEAGIKRTDRRIRGLDYPPHRNRLKRIFGEQFFGSPQDAVLRLSALAICALVVLETTYMILAGRMPGPVWFDVAASGSLLFGILLGAFAIQRRQTAEEALGWRFQNSDAGLQILPTLEYPDARAARQE